MEIYGHIVQLEPGVYRARTGDLDAKTRDLQHAKVFKTRHGAKISLGMLRLAGSYPDARIVGVTLAVADEWADGRAIALQLEQADDERIDYILRKTDPLSVHRLLRVWKQLQAVQESDPEWWLKDYSERTEDRLSHNRENDK